MTDHRKILLAVAPRGKAAILDGFAAALPQVVSYADLTTNLRLAMFIAQCAHESDGFATTAEYGSGKAYEGRKDLGNSQPGDGVRFKGRGLIQITGRANYSRAAAALNLPLVSNPTRASEFPTAAQTAAWFWKSHDLNAPADRGSVSAVTLRINGGENGLASREAYYKRALAALADLKGALTNAAAQETAKAKTKTASAVALAAPATASVSAGASGLSPVPFVVAGLALAGLAAWLFLSIRKHRDVAATLTEAAKEA